MPTSSLVLEQIAIEQTASLTWDVTAGCQGSLSESPSQADSRRCLVLEQNAIEQIASLAEWDVTAARPGCRGSLVSGPASHLGVARRAKS